MFRKEIPAIFAMAMLFVASAAEADIVELPLDCGGTYDFNSPPWSTDFDFGLAFTDISHVYMDWSGEITAGLAILYSDPNNPFPQEVGIYASLPGSTYTRVADVWGGEATYTAPELFDCLSEIESSGTTTWSDLFDGQGTITVRYTEWIMSNGKYVEHGSIVLSDATLIVDGTPVPEPATVLLLAIGILGIRVNRRNKSRQYKQE